VIVNLGGIANITVLQPGQPVVGFDTGPANTLLDDWVAQHLGTAFDASGTWAAAGEVDLRLLERLLDDPFFSKPHPKSTGQDHFNKTWLHCRLSGKETPVDVQATLAQLTARTVIDAIRSSAGTQPIEAFACGGGAHNAHLMTQLRAADNQIAWDSTAALGIAPDWVEATAFAWLAHQTICGRTGTLSTVTGARGPRILGAVYPA
jgi:anhydro-N-acetylmuramic acid kinase